MRSSAVLGFAAAVMAAPSVNELAASCATTLPGTFEISVVKVAGMDKREIAARTNLVISLDNSVLTDAKGRTGYIATNYQFQFDGPPQNPHKQVSGFSVCTEGNLNLLALDGSTQFYQCLSGDFYNLYTKNSAAQCSPVQILVMATGGGAVTQSADGQAGSGKATQITDGQVQAASGVPVTQITDGQIQAPSSIAVVTQITDGQVQAPTNTGAPVTQITDGQVQAPTSAAVVTQITDGQVQAPTSAAVVTQITDGQVQAPTSVAVVTQITDGQVQAPTSVGTVGVVPTSTPSLLPASSASQILPGALAFLAAAVAVLAL